MTANKYRDVPTAGMAFILAHTVFRALKHELKDFHRGRIAKVQILSLRKEKKKIQMISVFILASGNWSH